MMDNNKRKKQVRRRKVAQLAAYSRRYTVNNNVIGSKTESMSMGKDCTPFNVTIQNGKVFYQQPFKKGGHLFEIADKPDKYGLRFNLIEERVWEPVKRKLTKSLRKKYKKKYRDKNGNVRKIIERVSDYDLLPKHEPVKMSAERYKELLIEHKVAKWIRKHPRPVKEDDKQQDLFEQEFMAPWKEAYNKAVEHIREIVLSKRDKLPLIGRFEEKNATYMEKKIADIVDREREGDNINHLDPKKSPLLKKAQRKTNEVKAKRRNLVCTNLRDRRNMRGRIILPKAA